MVKPSAYDRNGRLMRGRRTFFPSRTLPYLAALTPRGYDVRIIDEAVQGVTGREEADLVVLTGMLPNMPRAMEIGRMFRERGIATIIGGIGVFSLADELRASEGFDSIVHGEAEHVWPRILDDFQCGRLEAEYTGRRCEDLADLPTARFDLLDLKRYWRLPRERYPFLTVETSRGCPHHCTFCAVRLYFGQKMRFRPIGQVVDELRELGAGYYILTDDNIMANPERARELFTAMKPLNIRWGGQFDIFAVRNPDVLRLAAESGCRFAGVGIESLVADNLHDVHKSQGTRIEIEEVAAAFREAGISMTASMIFGMDHDTPQSLDATTERMIASGVDFMLPWVLVPGPGSQVHDDLKAQGRLLHENYSLYNGIDVVYQPKHMTPHELDASTARALKRFYNLRYTVPRGLRATRRLDVLGMGLYFWRVTRSGGHPFCGMV